MSGSVYVNSEIYKIHIYIFFNDRTCSDIKTVCGIKIKIRNY